MLPLHQRRVFCSGSRETRTHKSRLRLPVFKTGPSSSRMTSVTASCGSWNRTNGLLVQSQALLPTATTPHFLKSENAPSGNCTRSASFKGSRRDYAPERVLCGSRTRLTGVEDRSLCRSAKSTNLMKAVEAGIEPASGRLTAAIPYQHRTHHTIV